MRFGQYGLIFIFGRLVGEKTISYIPQNTDLLHRRLKKNTNVLEEFKLALAAISTEKYANPCCRGYIVHAKTQKNANRSS